MAAKTRITFAEGDITQADVDGIVNAANTDLILGAGVAGAIRRAGGPSIQQECNRIGPIPLGEAAVTGGGNLKARWVIHAASMGRGQMTTAESLVDATRNSVKRADEKNMRSVAFPAIGTGVAGFPMEECARLMLKTVMDHIARGETGLEEVRFVLFGMAAYEAFLRVYDELRSA